MKFVLPAVSCLAILLAADGAHAAQRYASPTGSGGEPCAKEAPCSLKDAIEKAKSGDEVIVTAGSYTVTSTLVLPFEATNAVVHGDFSGPMPILTGSVAAPLVELLSTGAHVSYLDVQNNAAGGTAIYCSAKVTAERVRATASGANSIALSQNESCTVRDSLMQASGTGSRALAATLFIGNATAVARNVTAIASGSESVGISSVYTGFIIPGSLTLDLRNAIASGEKADLLAASGLEGPGNIVVSNSNFDHAEATGSAHVTDVGANQTAAPLFVNATAGDYREAAGSPTIDAGVNDQLGTLDLAGNPRVLGAAPDIGAFEFVPPVAPVAQIQSLTVAPRSFKTANVGGAIVSHTKKAPVGATVAYSLSAAGTVSFTVERAIKGRRVGGKCVRAGAANGSHKKCTLFKSLKGSFSDSGAAGPNKFKFSGRIENKALKPGAYKLVGHCGTTLKRGLFKIVR